MGTIETGMTCSPSNILKSAWLLVPPGMLRFAPENPYPATFYDEYKTDPLSKHHVRNSWQYLGGNALPVWNCRRFRVRRRAHIAIALARPAAGYSSYGPPIPVAFVGAVLAFYIHRNDLHYTLVMIKQTIYVFLAAYLLLRMKETIVNLYPRAPKRAGDLKQNRGESGNDDCSTKFDARCK